MHDLHLYNKLLTFPLFQGMSAGDLALVVAHTKLGFHKFGQGDGIVKEGDACNQLYFLVSGTVAVVTASSGGAYVFTEQISSPEIFQVETVFGLTQRFTHSYKAVTESSFITIDKGEINKLYHEFIVFRINFINIVSTSFQKMNMRIWRKRQPDTRHLIIDFFRDHSLYPAGKKDIKIKMNQLADEINDSRINVSQVLNQLQNEKLIVLRRGMIHIPALERLLM